MSSAKGPVGDEYVVAMRQVEEKKVMTRKEVHAEEIESFYRRMENLPRINFDER
jgi:hypothetical protein